jgi:RNA polymerase sigma factor (sigma-70 family)
LVRILFLEMAALAWRCNDSMDAVQFGQLIDKHAAALVLYARQWCAAPEDVVQEAFLKLMAQPVVPAQVVAWLFRVVRNHAISAARAERRRRQRELHVAGRCEPWFNTEPGQGLDAEALHKALAALPAEQREAIVAHAWGGLTFEQIGALAGCSTSMAFRRYTSGVNALRARMGEAPCPTNRPT